MDELTDETIMMRVKDGYLSELTALFGRYHVKLYNFFLKLTLDKQAAEDLTQEVFCRIIKYRYTYDTGGGRFISWIYRMARNSYFDYSKQQKKIKEKFKKLDDHHHNLGSVEQPAREGEFVKLDLALMQLEPEQRELIMLSRFSGLNYEEISKLQGKSVIAVRVQAHRAIKQLRKIYFKTQKEETV